MRLSPNDNRPAIAVAVATVIGAFAHWGIDGWFVPTFDPPTVVVVALYGLAAAIAGAVLGFIAQYVGDATWAHSSHVEAVREALARDPGEMHAGDYERLGLDPDDVGTIAPKDEW